MKYRKVELKDVLVVVWRLVILIIIEIGSAIYLLEKGLIGWWIVILLALVVWIVKWHCQYFGSECEKCKHRQQIAFLKEFYTLNLINKKYLKCEKCKKWSKAKLLVVE